MTVVAALDVGGTAIKGALVRDDGAHMRAFSVPTPPDLEARLGQVVAALVRHLHDSSGSRVAALGLAAPGLVDESHDLGVFSANLGWRDLDLRGPLEQATGLPVAIGHDVRAGLAGEGWLGAARGCPDVLFVPIGTGISAAVRVDGRDLVAGGYAGEIGHVLAEPGGRLCGCGARGCLEAVASARAIALDYAERVGLDPAAVTAQLVADRVRAGEPLARAVWAEAVDHLGRALALAARATGARRVVVGGGLVNAGVTLLHPLTRAITTYAGSLSALDVVPAELGDRAGCLGAGRLALDLVGCP